MERLANRPIVFDRFELDPRSGELKREGTRIRVPSQSIQVLCALLERAGDVVTRDELRQRLWPADTFVDFEHSLNSAVRRLREALGDSAEGPKYIETLPRRGYRYIGPVLAWPTEVETAPDTASTTARPVAPAMPESRPDVPSARTSRITWLWLAVGVAAAMVALWVGMRDRGSNVPAWSAPARLTFDDGLQTGPSLSPNTQSIAYAANVAGNFDIWTRLIAGGNPVPVTTHPADDWQADWSPDGNSLVFRSERGAGGIYTVPATGGPEQRLADFGFRPLWSPDGRNIVFARSILTSTPLGLHLINPGEAPRPLPSVSLGAFGWEPDSRHVSVLTCVVGPYLFHAVSVDIQDGKPAPWTVDEGVTQRFMATKLSIPGGEAVRWSSSGDAVFFIGDVHGFRSVWRIGVDPKTHRIVDGPHQVTTSLEASSFSLSRDAARLVFTASPLAARLWSYGLDDAGRLREGSATAITPAAVHAVVPDLSRDGKRLVFALSRPGSRFRRELVTREMATGAEQTWLVLDDDRRVVLFPRWSHGSSRLSYTLVRRTSPTTAEQQLLVFDPASNQERALTSLTTADTIEAGTNWTPDDQFIVSTGERYKAGHSAIALLRVSDAPSAEKTARVIAATAEGSLVQASMSPDGRWVVFRAGGLRGTQTARLAVISAANGQTSDWIVLTNDAFNVDKPRWSQNGDAIYFTSDNGGVINLWRIGFDPGRGRASGPAEQLTRFTGPAAQLLPDIRALEVGIGDGRIVLPLVHQTGSVWVSERLSPSR